MPGPVFSRIVIDTNIFVSQVLDCNSTPSLAVLKAEQSATILTSKAIVNEIADVFRRRKFDLYVSPAVRETALVWILSITHRLRRPPRSVPAGTRRTTSFLKLLFMGMWI